MDVYENQSGNGAGSGAEDGSGTGTGAGADLLAARFEEHRGHLRAVAYRMLGSLAEADDAVQESWLRLSRAGAQGVENLGGWLTTVVGRVCLDMLRTRKALREDPWETHVPEPVISREEGIDPEQEVLLADSVGLALLVVLEALAPAERLAFVLHDMFAVPFDEIAPIVERTPAATRQLASRARRRVQGTAAPDTDLPRQREVVHAFLAASRNGDFDALLAVLDPDVLLRADGGAVSPNLSKVVRGARAVVEQAVLFSRFALASQPALVNGAPGLVTLREGRAFSVMGFTIADGKVVEINILADPDRLGRIDVTAF
ncbi:RNA polymerase sigma factor SigJ [Streptomyces sp. NPDC048483]|uniref:RNA polymerase sigma factor SigJ n=1 Tax=Streptomyces sp. NPDC048483 TaxID=3154927 RepID=UPI00341B9FBA